MNQHDVINGTKKCNFTIDYILNHAGDTNNLLRKNENERSFQQAVSFSWLHCTRFSPPKLQRNRKNTYHTTVIKQRQLGRHPRIPFTSTQISILEKQFKETPYLSSEQVCHLSELLQLADIRIKIWFQNRRARERREKNQTDESTNFATSASDIRNNELDNCELNEQIINVDDNMTNFHYISNDLLRESNAITPRNDDDDQPKSILQSSPTQTDIKKHSRHNKTSRHSKSSKKSKSVESLTDSSVRFQSTGTIAQYSSETLIVSAIDIKRQSDLPGVFAKSHRKELTHYGFRKKYCRCCQIM